MTLQQSVQNLPVNDPARFELNNGSITYLKSRTQDNKSHKIVYTNPNMLNRILFNEARCNRSTPASHEPKERRALCPWITYKDIDENRRPEIVTMIKCQCTHSTCKYGYKCGEVKEHRRFQKRVCRRAHEVWRHCRMEMVVACVCLRH